MPSVRERIIEEIRADVIVDDRITVGDKSAVEDLADRIMKIMGGE